MRLSLVGAIRRVTAGRLGHPPRAAGRVAPRVPLWAPRPAKTRGGCPRRPVASACLCRCQPSFLSYPSLSPLVGRLSPQESRFLIREPCPLSSKNGWVAMCVGWVVVRRCQKTGGGVGEEEKGWGKFQYLQQSPFVGAN